MSLLWTTDGFANAGPPPTGFHSYNNDSGVWTAYTGWPDAVIGSLDTTKRCQGGWDGTFWYVIGTDGKLYRMNGTTQVWSAALAGGAAFFTSGAFSGHSWQMTSDGRFVYLLFDGADFRRYDPAADTLTTLSAPPNGSTPAPARSFLAYDGVDTIYANSQTGGTIRAYSISSSTWSTPPTFALTGSDGWAGATCLQGKLWYFSDDVGGSIVVMVWVYDPNAHTWTQKTSTGTIGNLAGSIPYGEDTDGTVRFWRGGSDSLIYNVGTDAWSIGAAPPVDWSARNGSNWAITRLFAPQYTYYAADGVTLLPLTEVLGPLVIGQVDQLQIQVKAIADRPAGATVQVVNNVQTDADDVVTISATAGGTYTQTFTTAALAAGAMFSVYLQVAPSTQQTSGQTKNWNLRVT